MGFPSLRGGKVFSTAGIFLSQINVCMFCCWDFSYSEMVTQTYLRALLDHLTGVKTSIVGISPLEVPNSAGIFPSEPPFNALLLGFFLLETQTLA